MARDWKLIYQNLCREASLRENRRKAKRLAKIARRRAKREAKAAK